MLKLKTYLHILLLLAIVSPLMAQEEPTGLKRFAIFAGSNDGGDERVLLEYAETDAMAMYNVLNEIGGLSPNDAIILTDPKPENIYKAFSRIAKLVEEEKVSSQRTEFFFYYSGHSDESGIMPGGELLNYSDLRKTINQIEADVKIAVLDSCSSGSFTRLKGGTKKAPFLVDESVDTKGYAFLTSSSENEAAQESDLIEGSFFTHYLITALRGAADNTQDGTVTLNEAYSFAADETLARTTSSIAGAQHPSYSINLTGSGDLILTDLREISASILIADDIDGRISFRDASDRLVIEFRKRAGIPVSISLPGGVYKILLETENSLISSIITVDRNRVVLNKNDMSPVNKTFTRSRGDDIPADTVIKTENNIINDSLKLAEEKLEKEIEKIRGIIDDKFSNIYQDIKSDEIEYKEQNDDNETGDKDELDYKVIGFSFVPTESSANDIRNISINFIGKPYAVNGIAVGFMNMTYQDVNGVQIGCISNITGRDHYGALASGIYNIINRDLFGFSGAGIFNITNGSVHGAQASGIFNISSYRLSGLQASGIFNISKNIGYGIQASGIFNMIDGQMSGIQASGIFNIANGELYGMQASGIFNVAKNLYGVQVSLVNIAKEVSGMQIGLININDDIKGIPIGLLTFSKNGILDFGGWYESSGFFYTGMQTGSRNLYNIVYLGFPVTKDSSPALVTGYGLGGRINIGVFHIDIDASVKNVAPGTDYIQAIKQTFSSSQVYSLFPNARLSGGITLFDVINIFGGLSIDMHIPNVTRRSDLFHNSDNPWIIRDRASGDSVFEMHPKWFVGCGIKF